MRQSQRCEPLHRARCDLAAPDQLLRLVRDLVATANSGGGSVVVGVDDGGSQRGVPEAEADQFDGAALSDALDHHLHPDRLPVTIDRRKLRNRKWLVELTVAAAETPPLVLTRAGRVPASGAGEGNGAFGAEIFAAHAVLTRRGSSVGPARRADHRRWLDEATRAVRDEIGERLAMVVAAPAGSRLRVLAEDEVNDEPRFFLSRAVSIHQQRPEVLLSADDLVYLWRHRHTIEPDLEASQLILHSALRKRSTLYPWLAVLPLEPAEVRACLFEAVDMRDRDKSDAARSLLSVCALYFEAGDYAELVGALEASTYAHMRAAAADLPTLDDARALLDRERAAAGEQDKLFAAPVTVLFDRIDDAFADKGAGSRRAPVLGLELLSRRLEVAGRTLS